ncbi:MAG TPA: cupin domain-containing protein [Paraburkholderia sp.]|jgi:predicted cupin superfamily sugar epimerase|nr:cupin domain-containing protein [Paraburkholderia sp.]
MNDMRADVDELIRRFGLLPHPEGGFYSETYRAAMRVQRVSPGLPLSRDGAPDADRTRAASTAIYYLLCDGAYSTWHRIRSDEVWHFYAGAPLEVLSIDDAGALSTVRLGNPLEHVDAVFQAVVPAGRWFAARCCDPSTYAFVGCTVAPGFEFSEFEIGETAALAARYPRHRAVIEQLGKA